MADRRRVGVIAAVAVAATVVLGGQPNPYKTVEGWAKMPAGRTWGSTSAVDVDRDGKSIWVAERCGVNDCVDSALDPVLKFDENGTLVRSFGAGLILSPHGIEVDPDGNVWVTDCACTGAARKYAAANKKGHQVFKFSPEGKLLLTLGAPGGGSGADGFIQPNDVATAPNGDLYVAEGHGGDNARIVVFDRRGKYLREFGKKGTGPLEFDQPHALVFDSKGRLFVGDRSNNRIQILTQDGAFLQEWTQFSRPSGIFIRDETIYVTDSESGSIARERTDWKRGIRIGSLKDGKVTALIPDPNEAAKGTSAAEGVAVDAAGNIYGAEVGPKALKKYVASAGGTAQEPAAEKTSTAAGVYTAEQASKGEETYMSNCVGCHPAGTYTTPAFKNHWNGRQLSELFALVSETMPKQEPASLTPKEYAQALAYLLKINDVPTGKTELPTDLEALKKIKIEIPGATAEKK